jgi:hypothetical protein
MLASHCRGHGSIPDTVHLEFVMKTVAMGQAFLSVIWFSPANYYSADASYSCHHPGAIQYV